MDGPKFSGALPYVSTCFVAAGIGFFGWQLTILQGSVADGRQEVQALRSKLEAERGERAALEARSVELSRRAEELSARVADAHQEVASSGHNVGESIRRIESREAVIEAGFNGLRQELAATAKRLDANGDDVRALRRRLTSVAPESYDALLAPTVKISSKSDVGSGTVVFNKRKGDGYLSYILTAHHIVEQNYDPRSPIPLEVISFQDGRKVREEAGVVVSVNPALDLALIEVASERGYDATAKLLPPERVASVPLYSRVHAMGCPLGYAPTPTSGELTSKSKVLDGQQYWMINAPTIFGNSGGGIYLSDTGEMIGVLSRISAYKNLIDVAVPHMGIITSMDEIYEWLGRDKYQFVLDRRAGGEQHAQGRSAEDGKSGTVTAEVSGPVSAKSASASAAAKSE